ncbi:MAG TPA: WD40 repeat domain-containing protein [Thermoanaerobaculia bacterium]|nr:WD40 repeat domain-containing protein [Thermoanaerobaculia bacterium]
MAEELRWVSATGSQAGLSTPVLARRKTRERLTWSAALIATAIIALLGGWLIPRRVEMPSYSFTIPSSGGDYRNAWGGWVSPDGTKVVFRALNADRKSQLWTRSLDGLDVKPIPGTEWPVWFLAWSPDSKYLAVHREQKVMKIPAAGGPAEPIAEVPEAYGGGHWNRDGDILLEISEAPLGRIAPGSRTVELITTLDKTKHEIGHVHPEFLPDGRRFLFIAITRDPTRADHSHRLYAGSLDSKETRFLGEISSVVRYVEPGLLLAVRDGTLLAYPFDVRKLKITGDPFKVADDVYYFKPTGHASFSASGNGVLVTQGVGAGLRLYWLTAEGEPASPIGPAASYDPMRISPDGKSLAVGIMDTKVGTADIWIRGLDRETSRRLTFEASFEGNPVWSPDGARLYYAADRTGFPTSIRE